MRSTFPDCKRQLPSTSENRYSFHSIWVPQSWHISMWERHLDRSVDNFFEQLFRTKSSTVYIPFQEVERFFCLFRVSRKLYSPSANRLNRILMHRTERWFHSTPNISLQICGKEKDRKSLSCFSFPDLINVGECQCHFIFIDINDLSQY